MTERVMLSEGRLFTEAGREVTLDALDPTNVTGNGGVLSIEPMLKAAYTATSPKVATTLYITTDTGGIFLGSTTIVAGS